jgi:hypothetical protein
LSPVSPVDEALKLEHEEDNPYNPNAIAIFNLNGRKVAYLTRHDAAAVAQLFRMKIPIQHKIFAKAKYPAEVRSRRIGPCQRVALGFACDISNVHKIKDIFDFTGVALEFK